LIFQRSLAFALKSGTNIGLVGLAGNQV